MAATGRRWIVRAIIAIVLAAGAGTAGDARAVAIPARLTDAEFWKLVTDFSEPDGFFRSDNLVSNEDTYPAIVPELQRVVKPGGVYIGVGPDQNFIYIAALKPAIAFIPDIRRGNLQMHLMYKALIEQSADRAEFLSRLFSRKRPAGLTPQATPQELFTAFAASDTSDALYRQTFQAVLAGLARHGIPLDDADTRGIEYIFNSFYMSGPYLQYSSAPAAGRSRYPSFAELQVAVDAGGVPRGYLATEEAYRTVRSLEQRNLIVPLVANFAGPKTLRAVGAWVAARGAKVTTFYASNVEQYLFQDSIWGDFAENLAALPTDQTSTFIRSCFNMCISTTFNSRVVMLLDSVPALVRDHRAGLIRSYYDVLARTR
jgi:hypothetical protein